MIFSHQNIDLVVKTIVFWKIKCENTSLLFLSLLKKGTSACLIEYFSWRMSLKENVFVLAKLWWHVFCPLYMQDKLCQHASKTELIMLTCKLIIYVYIQDNFVFSFYYKYIMEMEIFRLGLNHNCLWILGDSSKGRSRVVPPWRRP